MKYLYQKYQKWSLPTRLGLWLAVIGIIVSAFFGFFSIIPLFPFKDNVVRIPLFNDRKHLGDNNFALIGGKSLPRWDNPLFQADINDLIFYDKHEQHFYSNWGYPEFIQQLQDYYVPLFSSHNLSAWKHINASSNTKQSSYQGQTVQLDNNTYLSWKENNGNYYYRIAPVGRVAILHIYKELLLRNINIEKQKIKNIKLIIDGLHGGKRPEQPDCIELIINNKMHPINFTSNSVRTEEVFSISIDPVDINLSPMESTYFAIFVLPFDEIFPLPPPQSNFPNIGPSHFRDIEIEGVYLEITLSGT